MIITPIANQDKQDLLNQAQAAINTLDTIIGYTNPTNAQVVAAVKAIATNQKRIIKRLIQIA